MTEPKENLWQPFEFMVGTWKGRGGGQPGIGDYQRTIRFIFDRKFLEISNKSTYPPSPENPAGEVHQDLGYMSYDRKRKSFVLRQFHLEGFVNQYRLESISADGKQIVFTSEAIENIASGWRARETYQIAGPDEFTETFELASPENAFEVYTQVTLHRSED